MYFKCDMCYKIIKELETHDYRREGEFNGARSKKNKFDNIGGKKFKTNIIRHDCIGNVICTDCLCGRYNF